MLSTGIALFLLFGCGPTYKREEIKESVQDLAKKEYKLDVLVEETGDTVGAQLRVGNLLGELSAEDQLLWKQMDDLRMTLSRVVLSMDDPPKFIVIDVVDVMNPRLHFVITQYVRDIKRVMGEALSRTQFLDGFLIEFVVGERRVLFDPYEMDLVRMLLLAMDALEEDLEKDFPFALEEVAFQDFLAKVTMKTLKRIFRENKPMKNATSLRDVLAVFEETSADAWRLKVLLDLVDLPAVEARPNLLEAKILPIAAEEAGKIMHSYRFAPLTDITVVEKNTGRFLTVPKK